MPARYPLGAAHAREDRDQFRGPPAQSAHGTRGRKDRSISAGNWPPAWGKRGEVNLADLDAKKGKEGRRPNQESCRRDSPQIAREQGECAR